SSRNSGLPSVRAMRSRLSGMMPGSSPIKPRKSSSAPATGTGLATPSMAIFRAIVHRQHHRSGWHRVDKIVEECLGFRVDPVQFLEDEEERLHLTLPQEQAVWPRQACAAGADRAEARGTDHRSAAPRSAKARRERSAMSSIEPFKSANSTVTRLRSPSSV